MVAAREVWVLRDLAQYVGNMEWISECWSIELVWWFAIVCDWCLYMICLSFKQLFLLEDIKFAILFAVSGILHRLGIYLWGLLLRCRWRCILWINCSCSLWKVITWANVAGCCACILNGVNCLDSLGHHRTCGKFVVYSGSLIIYSLFEEALVISGIFPLCCTSKFFFHFQLLILYKPIDSDTATKLRHGLHALALRHAVVGPLRSGCRACYGDWYLVSASFAYLPSISSRHCLTDPLRSGFAHGEVQMANIFLIPVIKSSLMMSVSSTSLRFWHQRWLVSCVSTLSWIWLAQFPILRLLVTPLIQYSMQTMRAIWAHCPDRQLIWSFSAWFVRMSLDILILSIFLLTLYHIWRFKLHIEIAH